MQIQPQQPEFSSREQHIAFSQQLGRLNKIEPKGYCSICNLAISLAKSVTKKGDHERCARQLPKGVVSLS